jgi:hypothetical protein
VAAGIDPRARGFAPLRALDPAPGDVLLIHYSAYAPRDASEAHEGQPSKQQRMY